MGCPEGDTPQGSVLPTPQTVSYERKKRPRTDVVSPPHAPESRSEVESGPAIPPHLLQPPLTPSRTKTNPNCLTTVFRTTPHSQRIVPSSQWSIDEPVSASSIEANVLDSDPFLTQEPDSDPHKLTLPPLAPIDILSRSPTILSDHSSTGDFSNTNTGPPPLSSFPRSVSLSSSGSGPQYRSQSSQIVPTSQLDEIELKAPPGNFTVPLAHLPWTDDGGVEGCGHLFVALSDLLLMIYII